MFLKHSHDKRLEKPKCRALSFFLLYFRDASYIRVERLKVDENRVKQQIK